MNYIKFYKPTNISPKRTLSSSFYSTSNLKEQLGIINQPFVNEKNVMDISLHSLAAEGLLVELNTFLNDIDDDKIVELINIKDNNNKTPLDYACFSNCSNLAMQLVIIGAESYKTNTQNCWHTLAHNGNWQTATCLIQLNIYQLSKELWLFQQQKIVDYQFKAMELKLDFSYDSTISNKVYQFKTDISKKVFEYYQSIHSHINNSLSVRDQFGRTPFHYGAMNQQTNSFKTLEVFSDFLNNKQEQYFIKQIKGLHMLESKRIILGEYKKYKNIWDELKKHIKQDLRRLKQEFKQKIKTLQKEIVNIADCNGYTALHFAAKTGNSNIVRLLINLGSDTNLEIIKDEKHLRAIDLASNIFVRKALESSEEPISGALANSNQKNLDVLINTGCDVNACHSIFSSGSLQKAIDQSLKMKKYNQVDEKPLNYLLDSGADIDQSDANGWTALHQAAANNDTESAKILMNKGASILKYSNNGCIPLHLAAQNGHVEIIELLLNNNDEKEINIKNYNGCTPLMLAAKKNKQNTGEQLIENNCNIIATDDRKWTALHYASYYGSCKFIELLCRYDADKYILLPMKNSKGKKADEIVKNTYVKPYFNNIWLACKYGKLDLLRSQIINTKKEYINESTPDKCWTPLHIAVMNEQFLAIKFLVNNKAELQKKDKYGLTPFDYIGYKFKHKNKFGNQVYFKKQMYSEEVRVHERKMREILNDEKQ